MLVELNEADLLARMKNFEDHFVERKVVSDHKDWTKTAVAFANSAPVGLPAILYIGVRNEGTIETPQKNLDDAQRKFNELMEKVYPPIAYVTKIINDNQLQALAVIIPGSASRPHFAGPSYVRRGSVTDLASEEQYEELIAQRNSKTGALLKWKGQKITVVTKTKDTWRQLSSKERTLSDCNQFYVTIAGRGPKHLNSYKSISLSQVEINFDNKHQRLQLEVMEASPHLPEIKGEISNVHYERLQNAERGEKLYIIGSLRFDLYLCNHSPRQTNLQAIELDGSLLSPTLEFGNVIIGKDWVLEDGKGVKIENLIVDVSCEHSEETHSPSTLGPIDLENLMVTAVDGFLERHLLTVEEGAVLTVES